MLRFSVDRNGRVLDFAITQSTGYADLDTSTEEMMRGASLPPFPAGMTQPEIEVSVGIGFAMPSVHAGSLVAPSTVAPQNYWWCPSAGAYYPEVKVCLEPWQNVVPPEIKQAAAEAAKREAREAEQKYQEIVSERGYKAITFEDFILDGKELAASDAKVALTGLYVKQGQIELLFLSLGAVMMAQRSFNTDTGVGLLTGDAARNLRKYLLQCQNSPVGMYGCRVTVLGRATMCERSILLSSTGVPCVAVDDGWN